MRDTNSVGFRHFVANSMKTHKKRYVFYVFYSIYVTTFRLYTKENGYVGGMKKLLERRESTMKVTIEDIACLANVSKATVSRVLNDRKGVGEETRQKVKKIIDEFEYNPNLLARGISTSKTKTIGIIIPDITNPFFPALVKSIEVELSAQGYTIILCNTDADIMREKRAISSCISKRVDGIIFASSQIDSSEVKFMLKRYNMPCVYVDRGSIDPDADAWVFVDNEYAAFLATNFLIQNGNRRVAYISGPPGISTSKERLSGYLAALRQNGIELDPNLIYTGDYTIRSGERAVEELLEKDSFSALFAANDVMAIGAMKALKKHGLSIPDDVEVIGFDNISICELTEPPLTTIEQPLTEIGRLVARLILDILAGKPVQDYSPRMQSRLILRESTKNRQPYGRGSNG